MKADDRAKAYHKVKKQLFFAGLSLDIFVLLFLFLSGASLGMESFASGVTHNPWLQNGIYFSIFALLLGLVHFPMDFFLGYVWEHRFGLSTQRLRDWFCDELKQGILSFIIFMVLFQGVYAALRHFPDHWWIGAGCLWLFLSLFLAKILPTVIIPLFYKYAGIGNEELKKRIFALFEKCRVPLQDVYSIDFSRKTTKANAFICGWGRGRRVVLSDTLLDHFTVPQIETVMAHELGHFRHRDLWKLIAVNSAVMFFCLFLLHQFLSSFLLRHWGLTLDRVAAFPLLVLGFVVLGVLAGIFLNAFSRMLERSADGFSLHLTQNPGDFMSVMQKLGEMNLSEPHPGPWTVFLFYDHPPMEQRIAMAQSFSSKHKGTA